MKLFRCCLFGVLVGVAAGGAVAAQTAAPPLQWTRTIALPATVTGSFDHFGVDVGGHRLLMAVENMHQLAVLDHNNWHWLAPITGLGRPHAILVRPDLGRVFATDGGAGDLKVFNLAGTRLVRSIALLPDADSITFTNDRLYVVNGGGDAHQTFSTVSIIALAAEKKLADIPVDGATLEALRLDPAHHRLFVNNAAKNLVNVIDLSDRRVVASWPLHLGQHNTAMGFDPAAHRLFIGCRSGAIVVMNS
ncbi:MAG TPA: hypothetical protein VN690_11390, partial [Terriglobales bacterium]|nr:hypothetical protein [Terriglobales bacterium]